LKARGFGIRGSSIQVLNAKYARPTEIRSDNLQEDEEDIEGKGSGLNKERVE